MPKSVGVSRNCFSNRLFGNITPFAVQSWMYSNEWRSGYGLVEWPYVSSFLVHIRVQPKLCQKPSLVAALHRTLRLSLRALSLNEPLHPGQLFVSYNIGASFSFMPPTRQVEQVFRSFNYTVSGSESW